MKVHPSGSSSSKIGSSGLTSSPIVSISSICGIVSGCNLSIADACHPFAAPLKRIQESSRYGWLTSTSMSVGASIMPWGRASNNAGTHSIGKSRNHGLCGGASAVRQRSATLDACSQLSVSFERYWCHRRRTWNWENSSSTSAAPGIPSGT